MANQGPHPYLRLAYLMSRAWEPMLLLALFLLPIQTRWIWHEALINGEVWEYGRFSLYGVDLIILVALVAWFIGRLFRPHAKKLSPLIWLTLAGISCVSFWSIYFALDSSLAIYSFGRLLEGVLLFFLVTQLRYAWTVPAWTVVWSGVMQSLLAFGEFLFQYIPQSKWFGVATQDPAFSGVSVVLTSTARFLRGYGTFPHPNILGGFLVYATILAVALSITTDKQRMRSLAYAVLPLLSVGLLVSFSRQSFLGLVIALMAFPSIMAYRAVSKMRLWAYATGIIFTSIVVLGTIFAPLVLTRFQVAGPLETHSLDERKVGLDQGRTLLQEVWPHGVGIGNYTQALREKIDPEIQAKDMQPAHVLALLIVDEIGIFGLAFYALFLVALFWEGRYHPEPERRSTHLAIAGALVIIPVFLGLWDHYLWSLAVGQWIFWSMAGLVVLVTQVTPGWRRA